jgi:L-threonylcarbamoyladenylate synthase
MRQEKGSKIFNKNELDRAAKLLRQGKLVAFPTETVYGLGANALDGQAVRSIFSAKGRPADNPLIVHIATKDDLEQLIASPLSETAEELIAEFWPGPLTLVVNKSNQVPEITTGGLETVAVRMPDHNLAVELIDLSGVPLAAPSANLSGRPSPTAAEHVIADLAGEIAGVVDGGRSGIGVESTVLDLSGHNPTLLRPGGVTYEQLQEVLDVVEIDPAVRAKVNQESQGAISPGMKYKHYAPDAEVILVEGAAGDVADKINELVATEDHVGIMASQEYQASYQQGLVKVMGSRSDLDEIGANIFKLLRDFDKLKVEKIFIEGLPETGLGLAIMNRLRKSAGYQIINI